MGLHNGIQVEILHSQHKYCNEYSIYESTACFIPSANLTYDRFNGARDRFIVEYDTVRYNYMLQSYQINIIIIIITLKLQNIIPIFA